MKKLNSTAFLFEVAACSATFLIIFGVYYFGFSSPNNNPPKQLTRKEIILPTKTTSLTPTFNPQLTKEEEMKSFIRSYISDLQSSEWKHKIPNYFPASNFDAAIKSHEKFRKSFSNYKITIKHLAFDKSEAILWLKISAKHVGKYADNELKDVEPNGKKINWEEIWDFEIENGKFVGQGDFMDNGISRMKQLGVKCLPE